MTRQDGLAVRPAGQQKEKAPALDPIEHEVDEFEGRRIGPVHVLHHHQHGASLGEAEKLLDQGRQSLVSLSLGREIERTVSAVVGYAEQACDKRNGALDMRRMAAKEALDLVEPPCRRVLGGKLQGNGQLLNHRPQGAVEVIGRALKEQYGAVRSADHVAQRPRDARFADTGFANQQDALALAVPHLRPALAQQRQFLVAPHHRAQVPAGARFEAAVARPLALDGKSLDRQFKPLQGL
ncbi:MAG TPA: hypothetical protein VII10_10570 [Reyranella sp.]